MYHCTYPSQPPVSDEYYEGSARFLVITKIHYVHYAQQEKFLSHGLIFCLTQSLGNKLI
jgi:hypothetical protein